MPFGGSTRLDASRRPRRPCSYGFAAGCRLDLIAGLFEPSRSSPLLRLAF